MGSVLWLSLHQHNPFKNLIDYSSTQHPSLASGFEKMSYKPPKNHVIAHFLNSNLPNHTKNTLLRQNIVYYILPNRYILLPLRQNITT